MAFRITPLSQFERLRFDMTRAYARLANSQNQISTGKRIQVLSQDPAAGSRALDLRTTLARTVAQRESIAGARFAADTQATVLEEVSGLLIQARAVAEDAASGTKSPADLKTLAGQLNSILEQVVGRANTRLEGRYLFGGSTVQTLPFTSKTAAGLITSVQYQGDDIVRRVQLGPADLKEVDLSGEDAFLGFHRGATSVSSPLGLNPVPGANDTMIGSAKIQVTHVQTVIGDGAGAGGADTASGIAPGASTANDTIVAPPGGHVLEVVNDPLAGPSIRLNDGALVAFAGTETDLALADAAGNVVHVDLTGVAPGFTGTVDLTGNAEIAVAGGPAQALTFTSDFTLEDGTGRVVHLDTSAVSRQGDSLAVFPGTQSVFDDLIQLRDDILGDAGFSPTELVNRIQTRLVALDRGHQEILSGLAELGARSSSFDRIAGSLDLFELALEERRGELEDTDLIAASLELGNAENVYQASLAIAAKLASGPSLLNYL